MIIETGNIVYLYDGTFDGLLTCIFEIYYTKQMPLNIAMEQNFQSEFGQITRVVETDNIKSQRVADGFKKKCGDDAFKNVVTSFLSNHNEKSMKIYNYMKVGFSFSFSSINEIGREEVYDLIKICNTVKKEAHSMTGFVRFKLMKNGVYYSVIEPTHNVLPLIMPFFADRYCDQPFIIHSPNYKMAGYYDMNQWRLIEIDNIDLPDEDEYQVSYEKMWKRFYDTIAIKGRENKVCRRSHMPLKYWKNLTEMKFYK